MGRLGIDGTGRPVYVLIGGESRRFGADKASFPVDGAPWAVDVGRRLAGDDSFTLVGRRRPVGALAAFAFVADEPFPPGPIAGVLAALADRAARLGPGPLVLASTDLVRPDAAWLAPLAAALAHGADAAVYRAAGRWQPFPSLAHTRWAARLRALVAAGVDSFQRALDGSFVAGVDWAASCCARSEGPPQANTPTELETLLARLTPPPSADI